MKRKSSASYSGLRYIQLWLAAVALLTLAIPLYASAVASISQGYASSEKLPLGAIVGLEKDSTDRIVAASTSNVDSILGVVINDGSSPLSLSNGQDNQVQVATSGITPVLVSDINGEISRGDQITASPIKGVGMKATNNVKIVGIAQDKPKNSPNKQTYTDEEGKEQSIVLGEVPVLVNVSYYFKESEKTLVPTAIQKLANAIAGKTVNTLPILISAAIFLITLIVVASIIYSMIRSSIISVGRNPMSQSAIYRDVIQLSALVLGILAVALIAMYLVLTRF
ncbi:MAG: hypothetical protein ACREGJ_04785 [Candidatus Saccharimonadales bacterium]